MLDRMFAAHLNFLFPLSSPTSNLYSPCQPQIQDIPGYLSVAVRMLLAILLASADVKHAADLKKKTYWTLLDMQADKNWVHCDRCNVKIGVLAWVEVSYRSLLKFKKKQGGVRSHNFDVLVAS